VDTLTLSAMVLSVSVFGAVLLLSMGLRRASQAQAMERERIFTSGEPVSLEEAELSLPFSERVLQPMLNKVLEFFAQLTPARNVEEMRHKLEMAGRPGGWSVTQLAGMRVISAILVGGLALLLTMLGELPLGNRLLLTGASGGLGFYLPNFWLNWRIGQRKHDLLRALPDGLDMLNVCVGAGLGFDAALSRVGDLWQTALADEFNRVVRDTRLGTPRRKALQDFAWRTEVPEIENFVATIVQADQLGVSIAKVLRSQAEQMRIARRQRAEELARQATIKLLFPMVFLIFPALLAVLLGPAVPQIWYTLGNL
jgi:tight adherence protein C